MSPVVHTFVRMYHPWRTLRALGHITLLWHTGGPAGLTNFSDQTISLRRGMTQAERRAVLEHELRHVHRGPCARMHLEREERAVEREAAKRLIPIHNLGEAMAWAGGDIHQIADELWVDVPTVRARLEHLHPAERAYLRRRLTTHEENPCDD